MHIVYLKSKNILAGIRPEDGGCQDALCTRVVSSGTKCLMRVVRKIYVRKKKCS